LPRRLRPLVWPPWDGGNVPVACRVAACARCVGEPSGGRAGRDRGRRNSVGHGTDAPAGVSSWATPPFIASAPTRSAVAP